MHPVHYSSKVNEVENIENLLSAICAAFLHKGEDWRHEQEFRLFSEINALEEVDGKMCFPRVNRFLQGVILGKDCLASPLDFYKLVAKKSLDDVRICSSRLSLYCHAVENAHFKKMSEEEYSCYSSANPLTIKNP